MKRKRPYVGVSSTGARTVFRSDAEPTGRTFGAQYSYCIGPFRTILGAFVMATLGANNPHMQTVADAERLAKEWKNETSSN